MRAKLWMIVLLAVSLTTSDIANAAEPFTEAQLLELLQAVDERQRNPEDWRSEVYIEKREKGKLTLAYRALVFRRSADRRFVVLFTNPKASQGQGYLRVDANLWFYDPALGHWERRTERERIGGTDSRRSDFDESALASDYEPNFLAQESLGSHQTWVLDLHSKPGVDLAFPHVKVWIDSETRNVVKRQDFALSGRLLRTCYYPKWKRVYSASKHKEVWYPEELHFYDEVEKENSTLIVTERVELQPLDLNLFTKAWLESKAR